MGVFAMIHLARHVLRTTALIVFPGVIAASLVAGCARYIGEPKEPPTTLTHVAGPSGSLRVDDGGSGGLPVVFIHSFAGSTAHWSAQLAHLRKSRRAVALDLRGHGRSAPPSDNDYAIESLAADIAAVVDQLGLKRFVLVGHSLGGAAAIAYAAANPDRVAGLLLVAAPGKVPPEQARKIMAAMESDYDKVTQDFWNKLLSGARPNVKEQVASQMHSVPKKASLIIIAATFRYDPLPALQRYRGPKLAIITQHSETPNDLHNLVPQLTHKRIEDTSHWPHMDKPEEFNRLMDEFLASTQ
jgi:pimeloyl-ACP methyl ester carboxylesterase